MALNKININILKYVEQKAVAASGKGAEYFIEAAILENAFVEHALRLAILGNDCFFHSKFRKYWNGNVKFSQLIDYYELRGGEEKLIEDLRKYNKSRNQIVHNIFEFKNKNTLILAAKKNYEMGIDIFYRLVKTNPEVWAKINSPSK